MMTAAISIINDIVQLYCCMRELIIWIVAVMTVQYLKVLYFQPYLLKIFKPQHISNLKADIISSKPFRIFSFF